MRRLCARCRLSKMCALPPAAIMLANAFAICACYLDIRLRVFVLLSQRKLDAFGYLSICAIAPHDGLRQEDKQSQVGRGRFVFMGLSCCLGCRWLSPTASPAGNNQRNATMGNPARTSARRRLQKTLPVQAWESRPTTAHRGDVASRIGTDTRRSGAALLPHVSPRVP